MLSYWFERLRPGVTLPLAVLIAFSAGTPAGIRDVLFALLLVAQFRLWDDLEDRERDRGTHPGRVLARAGRAWPFAAMCVALGAVNLGLAAWFHGSPALLTLLVLHVAMAAYYAWRPPARTKVSDLVLLAKYPAFVFVLAHGTQASPWFVCVGASAIYALACAFEVWHDAAGPLRISS